MHGMKIRQCRALFAVLALVCATAPAQIAPRPQEMAAWAPIHRAAHSGNLSALRAALKAGAYVDARDAFGRTPLHVATFARRADAIRLLVAAGADTAALDAERYDAVTIAAVADDEATLGLLLQLGASAKRVTSRWDGTALIAAAHLGHDGVVRQLIQAGAPLDHVNNLHWTALIESIVLGDGGPRHLATLRALVAAGADRSITDREGRTPLALARERHFTAMVDALRE